MQLCLRPLTPFDYPLLLEWLQRPHVKMWWDDGDNTLEKVARHYGNTSARKERFILLAEPGDDSEAQPIGYMQYEVDNEGIASVDQFIGEQALLSQGIGTRAIQMLLDYIARHHQPRMATVDPHPANTRAIRCYEKVGFVHDPGLAAPEDTAAYMMKIAFSA